ncbi:hypothetical protein B0H17DRAFT_1139722 [Mycena rosella]|uniref:Uncharacterized protein n=1 Tax=Mycena rosella TaxID=1033263 RepID=A0AAD7D532_MYCRO|nr:hypothetical protein B0H17DRAFT_1139722 [Mycena rosella]
MGTHKDILSEKKKLVIHLYHNRGRKQADIAEFTSGLRVMRWGSENGPSVLSRGVLLRHWSPGGVTTPCAGYNTGKWSKWSRTGLSIKQRLRQMPPPGRHQKLHRKWC